MPLPCDVQVVTMALGLPVPLCAPATGMGVEHGFGRIRNLLSASGRDLPQKASGGLAWRGHVLKHGTTRRLCHR